MTFPFSNSITGADGTLIRPAIKSPNFVTLVSGWSINKDGTAELNDALIRGTIIVGIPSEGQVTITDDIPAELLAKYSSYTLLSTSFIKMDPGQDNSYHYEVCGFISADFVAWNAGWVDNTLHVHEFTSQSYFASTGVAQTTFGDASGGDDSRVIFDTTFVDFRGPVEFEDVVTFDDTSSTTFDGDLSITGNGDWEVAGNSQGFGIIDAVVVTSGLLVSGVTTQTDVPELALSGPFTAGRVYEIGWQAFVSPTVLTDVWTWSVRLDTAVSGTQIELTDGNGIEGPTYTCIYRPAATASHSIHFSITRTSGTGTISVFGSPGAGIDRTHAWVRDVSDATNWRTA